MTWILELGYNDKQKSSYIFSDIALKKREFVEKNRKYKKEPNDNPRSKYVKCEIQMALVESSHLMKMQELVNLNIDP